MLRTIFEVAGQQRLAWSCAVLVALFLAFYGHAPVLPVLVGCLLAIAIAVLNGTDAPAAKLNVPIRTAAMTTKAARAITGLA